MKNKKQLQRARKWMRLHVVLTAIAFGVYFLAAFLYSPHFFLVDLKDKIYALADTIGVTARVLDAPVKPVVSVTTTCDTIKGELSVTADWADDENSYTYDMFRGGSLLMTNLTNSSYKDTNVTVGTNYEYFVVANGPMGPGTATSDTVSITTPAECIRVLPSPLVAATSIGTMDIAGQSGGAQTLDQTPLFSGTTNIPFAIIDIVVHSNETVVLQTIANANGYWEIESPVQLSFGEHTIYITATDPSDSTRTATYNIVFYVNQVTAVSDSDSGNTSSHRKASRSRTVSTASSLSTKQSSIHTIPTSPVTPVLIPFDFILRTEGDNRTFFQGKTISAEVAITRVDANNASAGGTIRYALTDGDGNAVISVEKSIEGLRAGKVIRESIPLPADLKQGEYVLLVEFSSGKFTIVRTMDISVMELPLSDLGGGVVITYPQFVRNIGWIAFLSLTLLLGWFLLWIREYWLYAHAAQHVAERNLAGKGLITKRKGVSS
ncbi:MAG: Ig-like domain-containing protein [Candidatus Moranbacteria bacterium]|nr:Ig-like domain-containing protein [Candidatus Moranbacteria bacterium]